MKWPLIDMEEMIEKGLISLGRGNVISKLDIAACPGTFPIYSSAQMNNGKFGEYGKYMFDQELITWSVDGGGQFFYRQKHKFSVTNVAGTLQILNSNLLDCKYLYYILSNKHSRLKFDWIRKAHPSVIRRLYKEIPLPPLEDQKRIAHLLAKVEGLIAQRQQHLQQLDDLLKSVFLEMFGDPVRNEKGWDKPELKAFGKIITGNTPSRKEPANYDSDFIEWIKTDNITGNTVFVTPSTEHLSEVGARKARTLTNGALLVACIAGSVESIGRAALTDRTVSFNQQINAIQPGEDINPLYLYGLFKLSRSYIQSHATKGMKKILTKGDFEKIAMIKPPIEIQNQFAVIIEKVEGIKSRYQQSLTDLEILYGSLSQQAFNGELNLSRIHLPKKEYKELDLSKITTFSDQVQKASKKVISQLNAFNKQHSSIIKMFENSSALKMLNLPAIRAAQELAEQASLWRTPLDQIRNMQSVARAMETLTVANNAKGLESASILAKQIANTIPKVDMDWLKDQQAMIESSIGPFSKMQESLAALRMPEETIRTLRKSDKAMRDVQALLPNTKEFARGFTATFALTGNEEGSVPRYIFTRHDILQVLSEDQPLSLGSLMDKLSELEVISLQAYERIKTLVFALLNEGEIEQSYNEKENTIILKALA